MDSIPAVHTLPQAFPASIAIRIMNLDLFASLFIFALIATITPGPNNVMLLASGVNYGVVRSMPHLLGIMFGFPLMLVLIGLGFGTVFERFPQLHSIIKVLGVLYLLYLAWRIAQAGQAESDESRTRPLTFVEAALFQWLNPKGWVMGTSALVSFTSLEGSFLLQVLIVAGTFFLVSMPGAGCWLLFGAGLQRFLRDARYLRWFNVSMALLLVLSIVPIVVDALS